MHDLIIEFYSEEIPAGVQEWAASKIDKKIKEDFKEANLSYMHSKFYWAPTRLSVLFYGVSKKSSDVLIEKRGPRLGAKSDAIKGFAKNLGIKKNDLIIQKTKNGDFYFYKITKKGLDAKSIIEASIKNVVKNFSWTKSMRWGSGDLRWIRPLRKILCVYNGHPIKFKIDNISSDKITFGHRFISKNKLIIDSNDDYIKKLEKSLVIVDAKKRISKIVKDGNSLALSNKLSFKPDLTLIKEVANLVEFPYVFIGEFSKKFLKLPSEILELTLIKQQKYFPLYNSNGSLSRKFLGVSNVAIKKNSGIIKGNSRVIKARLSDAQFFYENDLKNGLESISKGLKNIIFHNSLGSMLQKTNRVSRVCETFYKNFKANKKYCIRSSKLFKSDLCSQVVHEMPELQGLIGSKYALLNGEPKQVYKSIREHYSPLGPSDSIPSIPESSLLAFADKLDSLIGFISIGLKPTGSKDPFGIRRAGLGIIRIIIERKLTISLKDVINSSIKSYNSQNVNLVKNKEEIFRESIGFIYERLKFYMREKNISNDRIEAVMTLQDNYDLYDEYQKIIILNNFLNKKDGLELIAVEKRTRRILYLEEKKVNKIYKGNVKSSLFQVSEEKDLYLTCKKNSKLIKSAIKNKNYKESLDLYKDIKWHLNIFFNKVLVNVDQSNIKANRLNILSLVREIFSEYADFSIIDLGNENK